MPPNPASLCTLLGSRTTRFNHTRRPTFNHTRRPLAGVTTGGDAETADDAGQPPVTPTPASEAPAGAPGTAGLPAVLAAKRQALANGEPIPKAPPTVGPAAPVPVGFVPVAGQAVLPVGAAKRPPVTAGPAAPAEEAGAAAIAAGPNAAGHSKAQTHGMVSCCSSVFVLVGW